MVISIGGSQSSAGRQPGAPIIGSASGGNGQATVSFTAPAYLGKPSTNNLYTATSSPGNISATGTSSPITVTGLSNGTSYTFTVTLRTRSSDNSTIAISLPSAASNSVTPVSPPAPPPPPPVTPPPPPPTTPPPPPPTTPPPTPPPTTPPPTPPPTTPPPPPPSCGITSTTCVGSTLYICYYEGQAGCPPVFCIQEPFAC